MIVLQVIAVFAANFAAEFLYVAFVRYINSNEAAKAASCSTAIVLFITFNIVKVVQSDWFLVPALAGAFIGSYLTVKMGKPSSCRRLGHGEKVELPK